jgi:hypothetical protein
MTQQTVLTTALADAYATNGNNAAHQCFVFAVFLADA